MRENLTLVCWLRSRKHLVYFQVKNITRRSTCRGSIPHQIEGDIGTVLRQETGGKVLHIQTTPQRKASTRMEDLTWLQCWRAREGEVIFANIWPQCDVHRHIYQQHFYLPRHYGSIYYIMIMFIIVILFKNLNNNILCTSHNYAICASYVHSMYTLEFVSVVVGSCKYWCYVTLATLLP